MEEAERKITPKIQSFIEKTAKYEALVIVVPYQNDNVCVKSHVGLKNDYQNYSGDNRFQAKDFRTLSTEETAKYKGMLPVAGINADLYDKNPDKPLGVNIEEGEKYHSSIMNPNWWAFVIDDQENISFKTNQELKDISDTSNLNSAAGFYYFYKDGQLRDNNFDYGDGTISTLGIVEKNGQKFIATITKHGKFLGEGVSVDDAVEIFSKYGKLKDAILFDGGASPAYYYRGESEDTFYDIISGVYFYEGENCK